MQDLMVTLLICSVTMSVLALIFMAATPLLEKLYSTKWRYYAWLIIVVGLIIPFRPHFDNAIVKVNTLRESVMPVIQIGNEEPINIPAITAENFALPTASPMLSISWWHIVAAIWLVGMIIFLIRHVIKHYSFIKLTIRWSENVIDEQTLTLYKNLKSEMGISKNIGLKLCTSVGSPMMMGFVKPMILLPKKEFAQDELLFILKHELIHYKRKDLWYKCLVLIASAIHWFNPIIYLMTKVINILCELSCDDEIVRGMNMDARQFYSETIIGVVRNQSKLIVALSTNFYGGKKGMKKRIYSIMDTRKKRAGIVILCAVLILAVGASFVFAFNGEQPNKEDESLAGERITGTSPELVNEDNELNTSVQDETTLDTPTETDITTLEGDIVISNYQTDIDFIYSPDGNQISEASYGAAKAMLEADADSLAQYLIDPEQAPSILRNESDIFADVVKFVFKISLDSIISDEEVRTSYEYALNGDDSNSYISMTLKLVDGEWKLSSIGKEK